MFTNKYRGGKVGILLTDLTPPPIFVLLNSNWFNPSPNIFLLNS